jgi:hypothetical protein
VYVHVDPRQRQLDEEHAGRVTPLRQGSGEGAQHRVRRRAVTHVPSVHEQVEGARGRLRVRRGRHGAVHAHLRARGVHGDEVARHIAPERGGGAIADAVQNAGTRGVRLLL